MLPRNSILQNRYRILNVLGQGGMGAVYQAVDERLNSVVALKERVVEGDQIQQAFFREASLLANLSHPSLPVVTDHFIENQRQFLVMRFIPGDDLAQALEKQVGPFQISTVLDWADQLLDTLEYLHSTNPPIIHRDIKPANLKVGERGRLILLDFGLAKGAKGQMSTWVAGKTLLGFTRNYAPLEQINGVETDPKSDVYSLGATLYHLVTGSIPVDASKRYCETDEGKPDPLRDAHLVNPEVPLDISAVLKRAMALRRADRIPTAGDMRYAFRNCARPIQSQENVVTVVDRRGDDSFVVRPAPSEHISPRELKFEYWTQLDKALRANNSVVRLRPIKPGFQVTSLIGNSQAQLFATVSIRQNRLAVGLRLLNRKDLYQAFEMEREIIQDEIAPNQPNGFRWREQKDEQKISEITQNLQPENLYWRERWPDYLAWHTKQLELFHKAFDHRIRKLTTKTPSVSTPISPGPEKSHERSGAPWGRLFDSRRADQLPISLMPANSEDFKRDFLRTRKAHIIIRYKDGTERVKPWKLTNFTASSNLLGNLRSRPDFRQGRWQELGITSVRVEIADEEKYRETGYLAVGTEFSTHAEACNLFGHSYKHYQPATARHPAEPDKVIWFPRFYENEEWHTWIAKDQETIYEKRKNDNGRYIFECLDQPDMFKRLVFAATKPRTYEFKGLFEIDAEESRRTTTITYRRTATRVKTYSK